MLHGWLLLPSLLWFTPSGPQSQTTHIVDRWKIISPSLQDGWEERCEQGIEKSYLCGTHFPPKFLGGGHQEPLNYLFVEDELLC